MKFNAMFDYKGYSEERLLRLCDSKMATKRPCDMVYWASEHYSIGSFLRGYASYPSWLPLFIYSQHGAGYDPIIAPHEIENDAEAMLVCNREALKNYQEVSDKPCYLITMPYVWYRRSRNIAPSPDAQGSLVFPSHSTMEIDVVFDVTAYIRELRALPEEFHPIVVCLHKSDIVKGMHKAFMEQGLPVYTAGNPEDIYFGNRWYEILRQFKYTMSNDVGSYAYYSVEMGIPFSLFGEMGQLFNRTDPNAPKGRIDLSLNKYVKEASSVFSGVHTQISNSQKEFMEYVIGIGQGLTKQELHQLLSAAYRKRRGRFILDSLEALKLQAKRTRRKIKRGILEKLGYSRK